MPSETSFLKIRYSKSTDEIKGFPAEVSEPGAKTIDKFLEERTLTVKEHGVSFTAASGELVKATANIGVTLPTPTANATVGVLANGHEVELKGGSALMFIGGPTGLTPVTISGGQYVVFEADGTNWYAIALSMASAKAIVATEQETSSATYATLATPDEVAVTLPESGLIAIAYQGMWNTSASSGVQIALFIDGNQIKRANTGAAAPQTVEYETTKSGWHAVASTSFGGFKALVGSTEYTGDVTTGQVIGVDSGGESGVAYIFAAAGIHKVSVRYKCTAASVKAKNRKLWAWVVA